MNPCWNYATSLRILSTATNMQSRLEYFLTRRTEFWNILRPMITRQIWIINFAFGHKLIFILKLEFADLR